MRITYTEKRFTAKKGEQTIAGKFTPDGTPETFYNFLNAVGRNFGSHEMICEKEKRFDWGLQTNKNGVY